MTEGARYALSSPMIIVIPRQYIFQRYEKTKTVALSDD